jgi:N-acetylmuramoyl-L-alanine amidase
MIYKCKPKTIGIYINKNRKKIESIYNELKQNNPELSNQYDLVLFNGMLFNGNFTPCMHLKVSGKTLSADPYKYWGYGWDSNKSNVEIMRDYTSADNYICGNCLLKDGKEEFLYYDTTALGGKRPRTAWGVQSDGTHVIYCVTDVGRTLEDLQTYFRDTLKCDSAIALDGGGSTQGMFPTGRVYSTDLYNSKIKEERVVHSLIYMWVEKSGSNPVQPPPTQDDTNQNKDKNKPLICIDAGHGYNSAGKRCMKSIDPNETREWTLNNRMANHGQEMLKKYQCNIMRSDDITGNANVELADRVKKANDSNADLFISIHHNAGINGGGGGGITVFHAKQCSQTSKDLAKLVYDKTVQKTGLKGNRYQTVIADDFYVVKYTNMPAILGEFGFMDSTTDVPIILTDTFSKKCAEGIVESIVEILNLEKIPDTVIAYRVKVDAQQVGVFLIKDNANNLISKLKDMGVTAYYEEIE